MEYINLNFKKTSLALAVFAMTISVHAQTVDEQITMLKNEVQELRTLLN